MPIENHADAQWTVYVHTSPSGKHYVGCTKMDVRKRWGCNGNGYKAQPRFMNAIQKYGWDNFKHEIVADYLLEKDALQLEISLILKLKANDPEFGYNVTGGGRGFLGVRRFGPENPFYGKHHNEESKKRMSENHSDISGEKNPFWNQHHSKETKRIISQKARKRRCPSKYVCLSAETKKAIAQKHSMSILQYDLKNNLIAEYESISEAERSGYRRASIRNVCQGKRETYRGCIWKFKSRPDIINKAEDVIYCISTDGKVIKQFSSYSQAALDMGLNRCSISSACRNMNDHWYYDCYWVFAKDYECFLQNFKRRNK